MSKKLIAVAAAAALALTGLVAVAPATAMPFDGTTQPVAGNSLLVTSAVTNTLGRAGSGTLASPYTVNVPSSGLATSGTTMRFALSATAARAFSVTATSGIKLVAAVTDTTAVVLTGADTLVGTTSSTGTAEFFVYPTSTTKGVVTLTFDGDITQVYITGNVGPAYDIGAVTLPVFELSKAGVVFAVVTDAFGNAVDSDDDQSLTVTRVGTGSPTSTDVQYSATSKRWEGTVTPGATAGQLAISMTVAGLTATTAQKAAFGDPNNTYFGIAQVATAKTATQWGAEVAALQAQLAISRLIENSVTQKKYNKLARKWNAAFPSKKVALKK
jgi:hypothetical protein